MIENLLMERLKWGNVELVGVAFSGYIEIFDKVPGPQLSYPWSIGVVRHPYSWLQALQRCLYGRSDQNEHVRQLVDRCPGIVGKLFDDALNGVDTALKCEDFPHNIKEFLSSVGRTPDISTWGRMLPYTVVTTNDHLLYQKVMESEREYCERYQYH